MLKLGTSLRGESLRQFQHETLSIAFTLIGKIKDNYVIPACLVSSATRRGENLSSEGLSASADPLRLGGQAAMTRQVCKRLIKFKQIYESIITMSIDFTPLLKIIEEGFMESRIYNLIGSSPALLLALYDKPYLAVEVTEEKAEEVGEAINFFREVLKKKPVTFLPAT